MQTGRHALRLHACAVPLLRPQPTYLHFAHARLSSSSAEPRYLNELDVDDQEVGFEYSFQEGGDGIPPVTDSARKNIIQREIGRVDLRQLRKEKSRQEFSAVWSGNFPSRDRWRHCFAILKAATASKENVGISQISLDQDQTADDRGDHQNLIDAQDSPEIGGNDKPLSSREENEGVQRAVESILGVHLVQSQHDPNQYVLEEDERLAHDETAATILPTLNDFGDEDPRPANSPKTFLNELEEGDFNHANTTETPLDAHLVQSQHYPNKYDVKKEMSRSGDGSAANIQEILNTYEAAGSSRFSTPKSRFGAPNEEEIDRTSERENFMREPIEEHLSSTSTVETPFGELDEFNPYGVTVSYSNQPDEKVFRHPQRVRARQLSKTKTLLGGTKRPRRQKLSHTVWKRIRVPITPRFVPQYIIRLAEEIPPSWTKESFTAYVRSLTNLRLPPSTAWTPRPFGSTTFIRSHLLNLISPDRPKTKMPVTTESLNLIMGFLHGHSDWSSAVDVFYIMEDLGCKPNADTYALFIKGSAKARNVRAMYRWIRRMVSAGVTPNLEAWAALYEIIPDLDLKQRLALETLRYNLVQSAKDAEIMVKQVAKASAGPFLDVGGSIPAFYDALQLLFGQAKLGSATYRHMLDALGMRGRMRDAVRFLELLRERRDYRPTVADVNILLSHCAIQENVGTSIALVYIAIKRWNLSLDNESFFRLFRCFHWSRRPQCLRVIWKVACLQEMTNAQMRRRILRSLKDARNFRSRGHEFFELPQIKQWNLNFGRFVCDVTSSLSNENENVEPTKEIHHILKDDLRLGKSHKFAGDFADLLLRAYRQDAPSKMRKVRDRLRDGAFLRDIVYPLEIPMKPNPFYHYEAPSQFRGHLYFQMNLPDNES